eukprot:511996_1
MSRKDFIGKVTEKCNNKKLTSPAGKLFKTICKKIASEQNKNDMKNEDEKQQELEEEKKDEFPETFPEYDDDQAVEYDADQVVEYEHRGYQEFQVWMQNWRNIQHRLRYLTFVICKYLNECKPSIIEIRIPNEKDQVPQYDINSFVFLNGYIKKFQEENCMEMVKDLADVN